MPFELQPIHLLVIAVVALLIFGPQRLPEIGRGVGRAITEFRKGMAGITDTLRDKMELPGTAAPPPQLRATGNFCIQCGAPNPPEARFCNQCGAPMPS